MSSPIVQYPPAGTVPEDLPFGVLSWDEQGRITGINLFLLARLGWPPKEMVGQPLALFWAGWPVSGQGDTMALKATTGEPVAFKARWETLLSSSGVFVGMRAYLFELPRSLPPELQSLAELAGVGLAAIDEFGRLLVLGTGAKERITAWLGRTPVPGEALEGGEAFARLLQTARETGGARQGLISGTTESFTLRLEPRLGDSGFYLFLKGSAPAAPFSPQTETLAQLAASAVHEIRNPLATVRGFLQLLSQDQPGNNYLRIALNEIDRLNELLEDLLSLSRQPRESSKEALPLTEIVQEIASLLNGPNPESNRVQVLAPPDLPAVTGNRNQLKQLFFNLGRNALEACSPEGTVRFQLRSAGEAEITVDVEDDGVGIPPEDLEKIFQPFYTTKNRGTGLGLVVCRQIVQAHNGRLTAQGGPGQGSTFTVILPALIGQRSVAQASVATAPW